MTHGDQPPGWLGDPAVEAGFAAAYAPATEDGDVLTVPAQGSPTAQDERDLLADLAARRLQADGRRLRAPEPGRLSPARALAGAAVSVAGVCLGIGTLLWLTDDPSQAPGPAAARPADAAAPADLVSSPPVETETAPVDPPPLPPVPAAPVAPAPVAPSAAAVPPPAAAPSPAPVRSVVVPVTVLNNSNRTGLADRAARRFERGGWPVRLTGNFRGRIAVTTVYYDPGMEASARAFAADFGGIARVLPRFSGLPARGVVVVLTREFAA